MSCFYHIFCFSKTIKVKKALEDGFIRGIKECKNDFILWKGFNGNFLRKRKQLHRIIILDDFVLLNAVHDPSEVNNFSVHSIDCTGHCCIPYLRIWAIVHYDIVCFVFFIVGKNFSAILNDLPDHELYHVFSCIKLTVFQADNTSLGVRLLCKSIFFNCESEIFEKTSLDNIFFPCFIYVFWVQRLVILHNLWQILLLIDLLPL